MPAAFIASRILAGIAQDAQLAQQIWAGRLLVFVRSSARDRHLAALLNR